MSEFSTEFNTQTDELNDTSIGSNEEHIGPPLQGVTPLPEQVEEVNITRAADVLRLRESRPVPTRATLGARKAERIAEESVHGFGSFMDRAIPMQLTARGIESLINPTPVKDESFAWTKESWAELSKDIPEEFHHELYDAMSQTEAGQISEDIKLRLKMIEGLSEYGGAGVAGQFALAILDPAFLAAMVATEGAVGLTVGRALLASRPAKALRDFGAGGGLGRQATYNVAGKLLKDSARVGAGMGGAGVLDAWESPIVSAEDIPHHIGMGAAFGLGFSGLGLGLKGMLRKNKVGNHPWQMTEAQFQRRKAKIDEKYQAREQHVEIALKNGEDVPVHVLADFPELVAKYRSKNEAAAAYIKRTLDKHGIEKLERPQETVEWLASMKDPLTPHKSFSDIFTSLNDSLRMQRLTRRAEKRLELAEREYNQAKSELLDSIEFGAYGEAGKNIPQIQKLVDKIVEARLRRDKLSNKVRLRKVKARDKEVSTPEELANMSLRQLRDYAKNKGLSSKGRDANTLRDRLIAEEKTAGTQAVKLKEAESSLRTVERELDVLLQNKSQLEAFKRSQVLKELAARKEKFELARENKAYQQDRLSRIEQRPENIFLRKRYDELKKQVERDIEAGIAVPEELLDMLPKSFNRQGVKTFKSIETIKEDVAIPEQAKESVESILPKETSAGVESVSMPPEVLSIKERLVGLRYENSTGKILKERITEINKTLKKEDRIKLSETKDGKKRVFKVKELAKMLAEKERELLYTDRPSMQKLVTYLEKQGFEFKHQNTGKTLKSGKKAATNNDLKLKLEEFRKKADNPPKPKVETKVTEDGPVVEATPRSDAEALTIFERTAAISGMPKWRAFLGGKLFLSFNAELGHVTTFGPMR